MIVHIRFLMTQHSSARHLVCNPYNASLNKFNVEEAMKWRCTLLRQ